MVSIKQTGYYKDYYAKSPSEKFAMRRLRDEKGEALRAEKEHSLEYIDFIE